MLTSEMITYARTLLSEPVAHYWTDAEILLYINQGKNRFCNSTKIIEAIHSVASVSYKESYDIPATATAGIKMVEFKRNNSTYRLGAMFLKKYEAIVSTTASNLPRAYSLWDQDKFRINPALNTSAPLGVLASDLNIGVTTVTLTTVEGFPNSGRVTLESEAIKYDRIDRTANKLLSCVRGIEGTVDAFHAAAGGPICYLRNILLYTNDIEPNLDTATPVNSVIPEQFQEAYPIYAASIARKKSKDWDLSNKMFDDYKVIEKEAKDYVKSGRWRDRIYTVNPGNRGIY